MSTLLSPDEIAASVAKLDGWSVESGQLTKTFPFAAYLAGAEFAQRAAELAEAMNHHPDILVQWRKVTLSISTHSAGGLTELDFKFASAIDAGDRA